MNHTMISIDLETRSSDPLKAAIVSIGMVATEWNERGWLAEYYAEIDQNNALKYGIADQDTNNWWAKQPEHAQAVLTRGHILIPEALEALAKKIEAINPKDENGRHSSKVTIVARSPAFDLIILRRHFEACAMECPWSYWQERDHRSLEQAWRTVTDLPRYTEYHSVAHHALLDAKTQASYLLKLSKAVKAIRSAS